MSVINNHSLGRFWSVSWTISLLWGLGIISMIDEPLVRLRVGDQHSHIRPILVHFVHYHSAFWGPRAISTIDEPRGSFMCPSSTLRVLANSDGFRGLLLTVLGSRSDFHSFLNPKVRLRAGHQQSQFGPILSRFLDYYSILGSQSHFHD